MDCPVLKHFDLIFQISDSHNLQATGIGRREAADYIERFVTVAGGIPVDGEVERGRAAWAFRHRISEDELIAIGDAIAEAIQVTAIEVRVYRARSRSSALSMTRLTGCDQGRALRGVGAAGAPSFDLRLPA